MRNDKNLSRPQERNRILVKKNSIVVQVRPRGGGHTSLIFKNYMKVDMEIERIIGQLESKVSDLIARMDKNDIAHEQILAKIDSLNAWKLKVVGASIVVISLMNFAWDFIKDRF